MRQQDISHDMASNDDVSHGEHKSARSKRKAKEKANARKRAAAGNVVNPYGVLECDGNADDEADEATADDSPKTSHSDASGETLIGAHDSNPITPAPTLTPHDGTSDNEPKTTSREWTFDNPPDLMQPDSTHGEADPDEPLTEAEIRHQEIETWLLAQKGHHYSLKRATVDKIIHFVYNMKYEEDREAWMKEVRLIVWRAAVRANFWWTNPVSIITLSDQKDACTDIPQDTGSSGARPEPIPAPTGMYESNFNIFVTCAAERLDRIGRDLPDPEYVHQIEAAIRLFFRRCAYKDIVPPLEHLAFLLMIDEEQNRFLSKEALQSRLRMCFDRVKGISWSGMGLVSMGEWPTRKTDPPLRQELIWVDVVKQFAL